MQSLKCESYKFINKNKQKGPNGYENSSKSSSQKCPFYNYDSQDTLNCEDKIPELIKLYPGGPCTKDSVCFSNSCKNATCAGTPNDEVCEDYRECYYVSACLIKERSAVTKYCLPQRKEKESCHKHEDCLIHMITLTIIVLNISHFLMAIH